MSYIVSSGQISSGVILEDGIVTIRPGGGNL